MPIFEFKCETCLHEWEDLYRNSEERPEKCPECDSEGPFEKLLSVCVGKVELSGHELKQKLISDGKKIAHKARKNEKVLADIVGDNKLHNNLLKEGK